MSAGPSRRSAPTAAWRAAALLGALALGGCGSSHPATGQVPPPVSATPSATATDLVVPTATSSAATTAAGTPTPMGGAATTPSAVATTPLGGPSPAGAADRASAEAFVRDYYRRLQTAIRTSDVTPLLQVQTTDCRCQTVINTLKKNAAAGITAPGAVVRVDELRTEQVFQQVAVLRATWESLPYDHLKGGKVVEHLDATGKQYSDFFLTRRGDHWLLEQRTRSQ